jgi:hypothetical protein
MRRDPGQRERRAARLGPANGVAAQQARHRRIAAAGLGGHRRASSSARVGPVAPTKDQFTADLLNFLNA